MLHLMSSVIIHWGPEGILTEASDEGAMGLILLPSCGEILVLPAGRRSTVQGELRVDFIDGHNSVVIEDTF